MKIPIKRVFSILFIFLFSINLHALEMPSLEDVFSIKSEGNPIQEEDITGSAVISLGLLFSGCTPESPVYNEALGQYLLLKNEVEKYSDLNQYEFGEKILELMYENVLTKYDLLSTEIQVMLTAGKYNCVSASLLYLALATDCGLDARVQETEKHAFITLYLDDGQKIDVETTNPYGFNPGKKKELPQGNNSVSKKYVTVPKNYYSNRKEASKLKAISIIAKNRCKLMGDKRDYKNAIPLGASAYLFVQNEKEKDLVRQDFDKLCGNFAIDCYNEGQSNQALDFFEEIFESYGKTKLLDTRYNDITFNNIVTFCNQGQIEEAREFFVRRAPNLDSKTEAEIKEMIHHGEIVRIHNQAANLVNQKKYEEGLQIISDALIENPNETILKNDYARIKKFIELQAK